MVAACQDLQVSYSDNALHICITKLYNSTTPESGELSGRIFLQHVAYQLVRDARVVPTL